jgi:uncharacterized delta-60 repeat protein
VARVLPIGTLLAWQLAMAGPAQAKAGDLDPTFGTGGKVTTDFGTIDDAISDKMAVQADGKPVAAGYADDGPARDFALARYTPNGALDPSFDSGGKVTTDYYGFTDHAQGGLVVQPDGKLVAAGASFTFFTGGNYDFALARYQPSGTREQQGGHQKGQLQQQQLAAGGLSLDDLTRTFIRDHLAYQFVITADGTEAARLEAEVRRGALSVGRPYLNPREPPWS